ncbi:OmpA family protein [Vibrio caribbeanicus]|uniref:OmpA family protein n=1 Tax=Vibrio caribbeanicus ATCC BAA-2122 TaxID=796620 RepID=E3BQ72_9VIBR|nr:OmpA family protein [Vibrio caribbeanicus]EFP94800.1 OmpA family protein [Vibrio caribbeanicus ATCC BAA-2122]
MMATRDEYPLYLMGRLYGANGKAKSGYFPLPFETLTLPNLESKTSTNADATSQYPIVTSNKHGRLTLLAEDKQGMLTEATTSLTNSIAKPTDRGPVLEKVLFFPSYLLPLSQMGKAAEDKTQGKGWMADLYDSIKDTARRTETTVEKFGIRSVSVEDECLPPVTDEILLKQSYFSDYQIWHKNNRHKHICVLEVPQFYTIQVVFSSPDFAGANVTLSDLPSSLAGLVVGNEAHSAHNEPVSLAKAIDVEYFTQDSDKVEDKYTVATFWIESADALSLHALQKYARIDIDLTKMSDRKFNILAERGIPSQYSLKENLFQLPLHTPTGRATVVCGDPISVEEALINHAPHFYPQIMQTLQQNPFASAKQLSTQTAKSSTELPEQVWQQLQTQKGWLEASMGGMENGLTWKTLAQVVGAAASSLSSDSVNKEPGGLIDIAEKATGVTLASIDFIEKANKISNVLNTAESALNRPIFGPVSPQTRALIDLPDIFPNLDTLRFRNTSLRPFIEKVGKAGGFLLDKPLTAVTAFYTLSQHSGSKANSEKKNNEFLDKITAYSLATSSLQRTSLQAAQDDKKKSEYQAVVTSLREELNKLSYQDGVSIVEGTVGDLKVRLDATHFAFNSDKIQVLEEKGNPYQTIGANLAKIAHSPFQIVIAGHTCDIGSEEVNLNLSMKRAIAVKNAILNAISGEGRQAWEGMFVTEAHGFSKPLPGNENRNEHERAKNRRVEILFHFSTMPDYPPSRSGLYDVEKAAKAKILSDIGHNEQFIASLSAGVDLMILGVGALFPPAGAIAGAVRASIELSKQAIVAIEAFDDGYKVKKELENIRYQDLMMLNATLAEAEDNSIFKVHLRAYLKRQLAFNGLIRLIKASELFGSITPYSYGRYGYMQGSTKQLKDFSDLNIFKYIEEFILRDDWEMEISLLGVEHLDEVWMRSNGYQLSYSKLDKSSIGMLSAGGQAVFRHYNSDDLTAQMQQKAAKFNRYYPVHYRASANESTFSSLRSTKAPKSLKKDVFKAIKVFVRRSYQTGENKPERGDWIPFEQYYKNNRNQITPYDNIRIVAILDDKKFANANINSVPVCLDVISRNFNQRSLFDSIASRHIEYSSALDLKYFTGPDKKSLQSLFVNNKAHGVIIEPSYFYGTQRMLGVRPVVDYDDRVMKSLFDSSAESTSSGISKRLSYFFQIMVPGCDDTEHKIAPVPTSVANRYLPYFNMTLNPTREYGLTKDFINFAPLQKADGKFYEESFLDFSDYKKSAEYPKVFDDAEASFYLSQSGVSSHNAYGSPDVLDPLATKLGKLRGKLKGFDWDADVTGTILIRSKHQPKEHLDNMHYDQNVIPLYMSLDLGGTSSDRPAAEFSKVFRLGSIKKEESGFKFSIEDYLEPNSKLNVVPKSVLDLANSIATLNSQSLQSLALGDFWKEEETVLFANVSDFEYINFFGHKVKGLRPMLRPLGSESWYEMGLTGANFNAVLSGPLGSGLENLATNIINLRDCGVEKTAIPERWYSLVDEEREVEVANKLNELTTDQDVAEAEKNLVFKPHQNLQKWMKSNARFSLLNEERIGALSDWVKDW